MVRTKGIAHGSLSVVRGLGVVTLISVDGWIVVLVRLLEGKMLLVVKMLHVLM